MNNECALVLGGTGFLGSWIVRELRQKDLPVLVLSRSSHGAGGFAARGVRYVRGDCGDFDSLREAAAGCRWMFHTSGYYPLYSNRRDQQALEAMFELRNVLKAACAAGVERFVFTSSPMALVNHPDAFRRCTYHYIKKLMHDEVLRWSSRGLPALIAVPGACFGPGDWKPTTGRLIVEIARRHLRFIVEGKLNAVDARDVAHAEVEMLTRGTVGGVYELGNWNCLLSEFTSLVAGLSHVPEPTVHLPYGVARILARTIEAMQSPFDASHPLFPVCGVDQAHYGVHLDSSPARKELQFHTRPIRETVLEAIEYFHSSGILKPRDSSEESQRPLEYSFSE